MTAAEATSARIELLTAEVRTLMVGSRQMTLSLARQLDEVPWTEVTPFGRIRTGRKPGFAQVDGIEVIGPADGSLVRSWAVWTRYRCDAYSREREKIVIDGAERYNRRCTDCADSKRGITHYFRSPDGPMAEWADLPLIVLAGLR